MAIRVGINGYGRIGRTFHRQALADPALCVVAINSRKEHGILAHLFQYDSAYGRLNARVDVTPGGFMVDGQEVAVYQESLPERIPWSRHDVDVVVEASGKFKDLKTVEGHLVNGASRVILCCPPQDDPIPSVVVGVNDRIIDIRRSPVLSNTSCTTNALAPILRVLDEIFGIESCLFRTIHAITDSQHLLDNADNDHRRARAAMESIIPTSTGASSAIVHLFPHLANRIHGIAYRVPTRSVSNLDLCVQLKWRTTVDAINRQFIEAANGPLRGILSVSEAPLVSIDFKGDAHSVIVDLLMTADAGLGFFHIVGWYDNEWGYSARLVDLIRLISSDEEEQEPYGAVATAPHSMSAIS